MSAATVDHGDIAITPLKPVELKIGTWRVGTYDAEFHYRGLRWLRYQGGFGERGGREDWVAEAPISIAVSHHQGRGFARQGGWGFHGGKTLKEELDAVIDTAILTAREKVAENRAKVADLEAWLERVT